MKTLQYEMKKQALKGIQSPASIKVYRDGVERFADFMKNHYGVRSFEELQRHKTLKAEHAAWGRTDRVGKPLPIAALAIQKYSDWLQSGRDDGKPLSAASVHTYLAAACKGLGIKLDSIDKPIRTAESVTKGRRQTALERGAREAEMERYQRLVSFARATGLRRAEIGRVRGTNLVTDICGHTVIEIKGKGGKIQRQRLLPGDEAIVRRIMGAREPGEKVFDRKEMRNSIDLHGIRRDHARAAYDFYVGEIRAGKAEKLRADLMATWEAYHPKAAKNYRQQVAGFRAELNSDTPYFLRGDNARRARQSGRPVKYDRLALMCVSVWHLAHWRCDVTIRHYML